MYSCEPPRAVIRAVRPVQGALVGLHFACVGPQVLCRDPPRVVSGFQLRYQHVLYRVPTRR